MARGPKPVSILLTAEEREALQRLVRRRGAGQAAVMRARIVLAADIEPQTTNKAIAAHLGVSRQSVITWRQRFVAHRLDGLVDAPRSGAPRRVGDEVVERMITLTLEEQPVGATHWSTRDMARRVGMTRPWCRGFGRPSVCSRTGARPSSCRVILPSSTRCATWSGFTSTRSIARLRWPCHRLLRSRIAKGDGAVC